MLLCNVSYPFNLNSCISTNISFSYLILRVWVIVDYFVNIHRVSKTALATLSNYSEKLVSLTNINNFGRKNNHIIFTYFHVLLHCVSKKFTLFIFVIIVLMLTDVNNIWSYFSWENLQPNDIFLSYNVHFVYEYYRIEKRERFCMFLMLPLRLVVPLYCSF